MQHFYRNIATEIVLLLWVLVVHNLQFTEGAGCDAYTGAVIRNYDYDYTSGNAIDTSLDDVEQETSHTGLEVVLGHSDYVTTCGCGVVTMWQFYVWHPGTVVFYVIDNSNKVVGTSSFNIGVQTEFNFVEIPLSSDLWLPIRSGYKLGLIVGGWVLFATHPYGTGNNSGTSPCMYELYNKDRRISIWRFRVHRLRPFAKYHAFTVDEPMITYQNTGGYSSIYYNTGQSVLAVGNTARGSGTSHTDRKYAVAAYIMAAHRPMFVNAPFETTLYTHEAGTIMYTASVLDLDGIDVLTVSKTSGDVAFHFDPIILTLMYATPLSQDTYSVVLEVSDGCNTAVSETITINLVNEGPLFENLPASTTVSEADTSTKTLMTLTATDASGDDVTCTHSSNPSGPFTLSRQSSGVYDIIQQSSPSYSYSSVKYYDIEIQCKDETTTRYSNFQVDVVKNEDPVFNTGSGYLPASISVERTSGVSIYQLNVTDAEGDSLTYTPSCPSTCPFSVTGSGEITTTAVLDLEGYDVTITVGDGINTVSRVLSVITSGRPYTHNAAPELVNLNFTFFVAEHTPVGTNLFTVIYTDENPTDTLTLAIDPSSEANAITYFDLNTTTGIISVKQEVNFEDFPGGGYFDMVITINDGSETQHETATETIIFRIVNVNEGITLTIGTPNIVADESPARTSGTSGTSLFTDPGITATDIDAGDTQFFTMDCGDDSKYFYLDTSTLQVHFAREYDMDSGLSGTATCNVTVRDVKGLSDTMELTLTVNNINDHNPKFPHHIYVFVVSTSTPFFTLLADLAASDKDSNGFGSTNGVLTYAFSPANPTESYFQIDETGKLYVRDVTTFTANNYVFEVITTDSGGLQGTCTVTVIFSGVAVTTTTSTERSLVFTDDYKNYFWLMLCGAGIFATLVVITLMVWKDPIVNEYISFKMFKLCEWCRKTPKPKEPKRTVGKLRVTINKKDLENDPDNALPWELLAKDNDVPEMNEVQEVIEKRIERKDRDYKNFVGLPVFEKGKGARPDSGRATVHSSASGSSRQSSDSPKYATLMSSNGEVMYDEVEDGGEGQWGDLAERRVIITPVSPAPNAEASDNETEEPRNESPVW